MSGMGKNIDMEEATGGMRVEELYVYENGTERGRKPAGIYCGKEVARWDGKASDVGHFHYVLIVAPDGLYVEVKWYPAPGYIWEEERIYKLILPGEENPS